MLKRRSPLNAGAGRRTVGVGRRFIDAAEDECGAHGEHYRNKKGRPFTSDLTGQEFWTLVRAGYRPVGFVMGNCAYDVAPGELIHSEGDARNQELVGYTHSLYDARETVRTVVAADTARFALPGVNVGVFCGTPAVGVVRNVARKRVMQMLLTGDTIDAPTAERWGLINKVVPLAELDTAIDAFADRIKARSAAVVARGKRTFYEQADRPLADAYAVASESMACNLLDPDAAEGIDAFVEKREPKFNQSKI